MSSLHIRPATVADYPTICALIVNPEELLLVHPGGVFPWTLAQLEEVAHERLDLTVMELPEGIIGFANLYGIQTLQHAFIGNVIIALPQRGNGYGRQLLEHMLMHLFRVHRLPEARISVFADNTPALSLYHSLGFRAYAEEHRTTPCGHIKTLLHLQKKEPPECSSPASPSLHQFR